MAKISQDDNLQDDQVLAKLYKEGAKDTPPAKLNSEILNYAANANKPASENSHVGSHFGGGWKVPLSMAASVVVVFALLVQLDQTPQQLELPPIPELSIPIEDSIDKNQPESNEHKEELFEAEENFADDASSFKNDTKESDMDSQSTGALIIDKPASTEAQTSTNSIQTKSETIKKSVVEKIEIKTKASRERAQHKPTAIPSSSTTGPTSSSPSTITKSRSEEGYAPILAKPQAAQKQMQAPAKDSLDRNAPEETLGTASGSIMQERSINKSRDENRISSDMAADAETVDELGDEQIQTEAELSPIPVEDWLLMIERLVAQKDYAEAARQLEKFKQAHPKVNVEDLDAKIP